MRGRAIFLLNQLGPEGRQRAGSPESYADPALRIAAFRAMRRAGLDVMPVAARLARDQDPGVRREVAVSLRDQRDPKALDILVDIARGFDGKDRSYLEALGTGATGKEPALYERLRREPGVPGDPIKWPATFTWLAWRLHVPAAVPDLSARAQSPALSLADRRFAMDTLAFVNDPAASKTMLSLAKPDSALREPATLWLLNRMSNDWADHGLRPALKAAGIYDPDTLTLHEAVVPPPPAGLPELSINGTARLVGDAARGKNATTRCLMCHAIGGVGADVGPALDGWGRGKSAEVIATALDPAQRGNRARLRGDRDQEQGRGDHSRDPSQGRGPADDPQHGRRDPDHPGRPHRLAPAAAGLADDERRAAGPHRPGRRRHRRVPARQLIWRPTGAASNSGSR